METTNLTASDIECDGCANAIRKALTRVPGVSDVRVDISTKQVAVQHDAKQAPREAILAALDRAGFPAG
jgi:Cu2+-exporting ATPase